MRALKGKDRFLFPFLCFITAFIPIAYQTILNGGFYHLGDDCDNQMLPFLFNFRDAFTNGFNTYMWNFDLGTPMVNAYGYYGLGSIFFYPALLIPRAYLPYAISVIFLLKYILAAYTAFFFIRKFTKTYQAACAGAILYAFSGLQCTNLSFYIFHDVTAVFPLLLISLEGMISAAESGSERRDLLKHGIFFSFAVFVNCATNYVFFVQSVVACIFYFLFRVGKERRAFTGGLLNALGFGTLGVGLSGIIFIPSIMYMLGNERSGAGISSSLYLYDYKHVLYILKGFLFPGDSMLDETALMVHEWSSTSAYLPFVGLILVFAYLWRNRNWLSRLTIFLIVISFIPFANGMFLAFMIVYHRWWYFLILLMALESALVLENIRDYDLRIPALLEAVLTIAVAVLIWMYREDGESLLFHKGRFVIEIVFVLVCALAVPLMAELTGRLSDISRSGRRFPKEHYNKLIMNAMLAGIVFCSIVTFIFAEHLYMEATPVGPDEYENSFLAMQKVPEAEDNYRYRNYANSLIMYGMSRNITGLSSYSSTTSNSTVEFDELFDYYDVSRRTNKNFIPGLAELLGGKYLIRTDNHVEERYPESVLDSLGAPFESFMVGDRTWDIYELDACPVGYAVDRVIPESELRRLPVSRRGIALLYSPVVGDELAGAVEETGHVSLTGASEGAGALATVDVVSSEDVDEIIDDCPELANGDALFENPCIAELTGFNSAHSVKRFTKTDNGYEIETDYDKDSLVYLTIPYDEGWKIALDDTGTLVKPISSGGMTLIPVPAGSHTLKAAYHLPWLGCGIAASVLSALILGCLLIVSRKRKPA